MYMYDGGTRKTCSDRSAAPPDRQFDVFRICFFFFVFNSSGLITPYIHDTLCVMCTDLFEKQKRSRKLVLMCCCRREAPLPSDFTP
jgi:hypothetical protein